MVWSLVCPIVDAAAAAAVLDAASTRMAAATEDLRQEMAADAKMIGLAPAEKAEAGGGKRRVRLPDKVLSALTHIVRLAQLDGFARAVASGGVGGVGGPDGVGVGGAAALTSADGTLLPKAWLSAELLARVREALRFVFSEEVSAS